MPEGSGPALHHGPMGEGKTAPSRDVSFRLADSDPAAARIILVSPEAEHRHRASLCRFSSPSPPLNTLGAGTPLGWRTPACQWFLFRSGAQLRWDGSDAHGGAPAGVSLPKVLDVKRIRASEIRLRADLLPPGRNVAVCAQRRALNGFWGGRVDHLHSLQLFRTSGQRVVDVAGWLVELLASTPLALAALVCMFTQAARSRRRGANDTPVKFTMCPDVG